MAQELTTALAPRILAMGMMALREQCVMPSLVNGDYSTEAKAKGKTVDVPVPSAIVAADITPAAYAPAGTDLEPTFVPITLNNWKGAAFNISDKEAKEIEVNNVFPMEASEAIRAIANTVNASIFALYTKFYGYVGVAGTTPFVNAATTNDYDNTLIATRARKVLNNQLAPMDNRRFVINPDAEANALALPAFQYYLNSGNTDVMKEGQLGRKLGFDFYMDQAVPTHTAGTITTGLAAKAATAAALGAKTATATTAASTGACNLKIGDIITFAGQTQTYVLTAAAVQATAATDVALAFEPGLKTALVGGEAITVKASHVVNLAFNRFAIGFANRALEDDLVTTSGNTIMTMQDPVSRLVLRLEISRQYKRTRWEFDMLWGCSVIRPELGCRAAG